MLLKILCFTDTDAMNMLDSVLSRLQDLPDLCLNAFGLIKTLRLHVQSKSFELSDCRLLLYTCCFLFVLVFFS